MVEQETGRGTLGDASKDKQGQSEEGKVGVYLND